MGDDLTQISDLVYLWSYFTTAIGSLFEQVASWFAGLAGGLPLGK
jgi:hypothetical protein